MTGKTPDYRETVEKLRTMVECRKNAGHEYLSESQADVLTHALALLTTQADELATLRAAVVENYAAARAVAQGGTLTDPMEDRAARWRASDEALRTLAGVPPRRKQESKV